MAEKEREVDGVHVGERDGKLTLTLAQARYFILRTFRLCARQEGRPASWIRTSLRLSKDKARLQRRGKLRIEILIKDLTLETVAQVFEDLPDNDAELAEATRVEVHTNNEVPAGGRAELLKPSLDQ